MAVSAPLKAHADGHFGQQVVVDLSGVTFFGSAGVAALVSFASTCAASGITLRVVPTPIIHRVRPDHLGVDQVVELAARP